MALDSPRTNRDGSPAQPDTCFVLTSTAGALAAGAVADTNVTPRTVLRDGFVTEFSATAIDTAFGAQPADPETFLHGVSAKILVNDRPIEGSGIGTNGYIPLASLLGASRQPRKWQIRCQKGAVLSCEFLCLFTAGSPALLRVRLVAHFVSDNPDER